MAPLSPRKDLFFLSWRDCTSVPQLLQPWKAQGLYFLSSLLGPLALPPCSGVLGPHCKLLMG